MTRQTPTARLLPRTRTDVACAPATTRRGFLVGAAGAAVLSSGVAGPATRKHFQPPDHAVIVPFPAGGVTDVQVPRIRTDRVEELGQSIVVSNRPARPEPSPPDRWR